MSASQGNATIWAYFSPEQAYEFTVSTHILAGTLAVSFSLSSVSSQRASYPTAAHSFVLDHVLGYIE